MGPEVPTVDAVRAALRTVAPDLADGVIVTRGLEPSDDPQWCAATAEVDGRFVVKFAWARPPALRICHHNDMASHSTIIESGREPIGVTDSTSGAGSPASRKVRVRRLPKSGCAPPARKT
jgi:hypothetical protein